MSSFQVSARQFILPKEGSGAEECEDAVAQSADASRFAVADGATEAFDARRWAVRLAENWVGAGSAPLTVEEFRPWLAEQGEWLRASWEGRKLPWYAEEKRRAGSFAAFVGLRLEERGRRMRWDAVALGDSCLVQTRGGRVERALPVSSHAEFNSAPPLVPSNETVREVALARLVSAGGEAERGDVFLLMSDALSAWYLESSSKRDGRATQFDSLLAASENEALAGLFRGERESKRMKDDDVAVVRVHLAAGP
ncbi:MAG TPA: protein phosphatase 2C domain-containing protein [Pyrinomonadaceae bacterium]|nr:protein phosphatase 2C domain-containing protein [Pyrinomonadaceae bacterium]